MIGKNHPVLTGAALALTVLAHSGFADDRFAGGAYGGAAPSLWPMTASFGDGRLTYGEITSLPPGRARALPADPDDPLAASRFSFSRMFDGGALHLAETHGVDQDMRQIGATMGSMTYTFTQGYGTGLPATDRGLNGIAANFFHGDSARPYRYSGATLGLAVSNDAQGFLGSASVRADGVRARNVYFAGAASNRFGGSIMRVTRDTDTVGHGLDLSVNLDAFTLGYSELRSVTDAVWRQANLTMVRRPGEVFRLSLESGKNRLYADAEDTRVMVSYQVALGPQPAQAAPAGPKDESPDQAAGASRGFRYGAIAVAGAIGAAAALSSGDSGKDNAGRYSSQHDAAWAALSDINPTSVRENTEYGGAIYVNSDGTYSHTNHVKGTRDSVFIDPPALIPAGTRATADYHTHGAYEPTLYLTEMFSPQDIYANNYYGTDGYLGTPLGKFLWYQLSTDTIRQLSDALPH